MQKPQPSSCNVISTVTPPDPEQLVASLITSLQGHVAPNAVMVGIHTGGVWVAERLHQALKLTTPLATLDISFYRDDFDRIGLNPKVKPSTIAADLNEAQVVLVDDVLYTGRTIRAAMNELFDYGRPARIDLVTLVDRGGRELPIAPRWAGCTLSLPPDHTLNLARGETGKLSFELVKKGAPHGTA
jgi:pyrimidine operon attenuation protein / uracil phosphoribosyltransferase